MLHVAKKDVCENISIYLSWITQDKCSPLNASCTHSLTHCNASVPVCPITDTFSSNLGKSVVDKLIRQCVEMMMFYSQKIECHLHCGIMMWQKHFSG